MTVIASNFIDIRYIDDISANISKILNLLIMHVVNNVMFKRNFLVLGIKYESGAISSHRIAHIGIVLESMTLCKKLKFVDKFIHFFNL